MKKWIALKLDKMDEMNNFELDSFEIDNFEEVDSFELDRMDEMNSFEEVDNFWFINSTLL